MYYFFYIRRCKIITFKNEFMIISTVSLKGGAGKTTICINLAVYFSKKGYSVIIVDSDVNNNISRWNELRENQTTDKKQPSKNIDFIVLNNEGDFFNQFDEVTKNYDIVMVDGRPAVNNMAANILSISDFAIMPIKPSPLDVWTNDNTFIDVFEQAKKVNQNLKGYFILNGVKSNTNLAYECRLELEGLASETNAKLFKTELADRTIYAESLVYGLGVLESKNYKAIAEINRLGEEITHILNL